MPATTGDPQQPMGTDEGIDGAEEASGAVYTPDQPDHGTPQEYSRNGSPHAQRRISSEENRHMEETDYLDDSETAAPGGGHSRERTGGGDRHYSKGEEDNDETGRDVYPQTEEHGEESTRGGEERRDGEICGIAEEEQQDEGRERSRVNQHDDDDPFADEDEGEGDTLGQADHTDRQQTSSGNDEGAGAGQAQDHPVEKKDDRAGGSGEGTTKKRYYYEEPPVIDERKVFVGNTPLAVREKSIDRVFGEFGRLRDIEIHAHYVHLHYEDRRSAAKAIEELNDKEVWGARIVVEYLRPGALSQQPPSSSRRVILNRSFQDSTRFLPRYSSLRGGRGGGLVGSTAGGRYPGTLLSSRGRGGRIVGVSGDSFVPSFLPSPLVRPPSRSGGLPPSASTTLIKKTPFRVIVSHLDPRVHWQDLKDFGREAGDVNFSTITYLDGRRVGVIEYFTEDSMLFALRELDGRRLYDSHVQVRPDTSSVAALPPPLVPAGSGGGLTTAALHHHHPSPTSTPYDSDTIAPHHHHSTGSSSSGGSSTIPSRRRLVPPVALPIEVLPPPRAPLITRTGGGIGVTRHSLSPPRSRLIPSAIRVGFPAPSGSSAAGPAAGAGPSSTPSATTIITAGSSRPHGVVTVSPGGRGETGVGGLGLRGPSHHEEEEQQVGRGSYGVRTATSPTRGGGGPGARGRSPWSRHHHYYHHSYQDGESYHHHGSHHRGGEDGSGGSSRGGRLLLPHTAGGGGGGLSPSSRKEKGMLLPRYRRSSSRGREEDGSNSSRRFSPTRGERRGIYYENRREPRGVDHLHSSRYYSPSERGARRRMMSGERGGGYIHDSGRSRSRYSPLPRDSMKEGSPSRYHHHRRDERGESIERIDAHHQNRSPPPPHAFSRRGRGASSASPAAAPPPPPRRLPPPLRMKGRETSEEILVDDGDEENSTYRRGIGRRGGERRSRSSSRAYYPDTRVREDGPSSGARGRGGEGGVKKRDWISDVSCDREYARPGSSRGGRNHVRRSSSHSRERGRFDARRVQDDGGDVDQYHNRNTKDVVRVSSVESGRQGRGGEGGGRGGSREMVRGASPPAGGGLPLSSRGVFNRGQTHTVSLSPGREAKDEESGGRMISAVPDPLEDGGIDERERRVPPPLSSSPERRGDGLSRRRDKAAIGHRRVYEERSKSRSVSPGLQRSRGDRQDEMGKSLSPSRLPKRESGSHRVVSLVSERKRGGDDLDSPPRRIERMYPSEDKDRDTRQRSPSISSSSHGRDDQERPLAGRRQRSPSFRKDSERSSLQPPSSKKLAVTSSRSRRDSYTSSAGRGGDLVDEGSPDMRHRRRLSDGGAVIEGEEEGEQDLRGRRLHSPSHSGRGKIGVSTVQKSRRLSSASSGPLREDEERRDRQIRSRSPSLVEKGDEPYRLPSGGVDNDDDDGQSGGKREGGGRREEDSSTATLSAKAEESRGRLNRRLLRSVSNERERRDGKEREDERDPHAGESHEQRKHRSPSRRLSSTQPPDTEEDSLSLQGQQREDERDIIKRPAARAGSREVIMKGGAGRAQRREGESFGKTDGRSSIRVEGPSSSRSGRGGGGREEEAVESDHDEREGGQRRYHIDGDDGHSDGEAHLPKRATTYTEEKGRGREYEKMEEGDEDGRQGLRESRDTRRRSTPPFHHERERAWEPPHEGEDFDPTRRDETHELRDGIGPVRNKGVPYASTEREVSLKPRSDRREGGEKGRAGGEASSSSFRYSEEDSHYQKRQQRRDDDNEEEIVETQRRKKPYDGGDTHRGDDYQEDNPEKEVSSRETTTSSRRGLPPLRSGRSADSSNKGVVPARPPAYDEEFEAEQPHIDSRSSRNRKGLGADLRSRDRQETYDEDDVRGETGGESSLVHDGIRDRQDEEEEEGRRYGDGDGADDELEESRHQDNSSRRNPMKRDEGGAGRVGAAYENPGRRYEEDDHHHRHEDNADGGLVGGEGDYHRESRQELDEEIDRSERGRKGDVPPSPHVVHQSGSSSRRNAKDSGDFSRERRRRGSSQSSHTGRSFQDSLLKERGEESVDHHRRSSRTAGGAVEIPNHRNRKMETAERDPGGGGEEEAELVLEKDSTRRRTDVAINRGLDGGREEEEDDHSSRRGKAVDEENDGRVVVQDDPVRGGERGGGKRGGGGGYLPPSTTTSSNSTDDLETEPRHHHHHRSRAGSPGGVVVVGGRSRPDYSLERDSSSSSSDGVRREMKVRGEVGRGDSYRRQDGEGGARTTNDERLVDSVRAPSSFSRNGSGSIVPPHRLSPSSRPLSSSSSRECGRGRGGGDSGDPHGSGDGRFSNQGGGEHDRRSSASRVLNEGGASRKRSRLDHDDDDHHHPVEGGVGGVYEGGEGRGESYPTNKRSRGEYYRLPPRSSAQGGERHVVPERQSMQDEDDSSRSRGHHYHPRTENGPRGYSSHHSRLFSPGGRPMEGGGDLQKVNILPVPRKQYVGDPQPYHRGDDKGGYAVATPPGSRAGGGKYFKTASSGGVGGDSLRNDGRHIEPYNNSSSKLLPPGHHHHHHPRQHGHVPGGGEGGGPPFSEGDSYHHSYPGARRPVTLIGGGGTGGGFPHHGGGQLAPPRHEHSPPMRAGGGGMRRYVGGGGPAGGRMRS